MLHHTNPEQSGLWRHTDFVLLLSGQLVSQLGNQFQSLVLPLLVLLLTGSTTQAGLLLGISTITYLFTGLLAGALVDRWNRKKTMVWSEVLRAILTASIPLALMMHTLTMTQLYIVSVLTGVLTVLFQTANSTVLPNILPAHQIPAALGASQSARSAVGMLGSSLAGVAYGLGHTVPFLFNAVSFLISALSLGLIKNDFREQTHAHQSPRMTELMSEISTGFHWLWGQPVLRLLTFVEAADGVRYGAGYLLIVELARQTGATSFQIGLVFTGAALGGLLGGLLSGRLVSRYPLGMVAIVMLWAEALAFPLYAWASSWFWLAIVALLESVLVPIYSVAMENYRLQVTPDEIRGRVNSALGTLVTGASAIGTILGGLLLTRLGAHTLTLVCTFWLLVLAVVTTISRAIRDSSGNDG